MLAKILDGLFFVCGLLGVGSFAGAIENNGNVLLPLILLLVAFVCYKWARYENGDLRGRKNG